MKTTHFLVSSLFVAGLSLLGHNTVVAQQYPVRIHSHNDYKQTVPFYEAYSQKVYSIEVDLFYKGKEFYVAHDEEDINSELTFDALYLNPILSLYRHNEGRAWKGSDEKMQLLVEIKSDNTDAFLKALQRKLNKYPEVFDPSVNPYAVRIVITGNVPEPEDFDKYTSYILFDGNLSEDYTEKQLERVGVFSTNFRDLSKWNGKGSLVKEDKKKVVAAIEKAHAQGKQIRFWGAPDGMTAWNTFHMLGVDYINTDKVEKCTAFFSDWHNKHYEIASKAVESVQGVTKTDRLDKTTHDFEGFKNEKLQLAEPVKTYVPSFESDGTDRPVKNVIFLIGDGMGLAQLTAADRVNKGLTILNMQHLGLISTSAKDAFTTDSAGAGSALATGEQNNNRHISMSEDGVAYPSLTDFFVEQGKQCGVVTLGNVADATPAAFYGHNTERDNADEITRELLKGKISLLAGSGMSNFKDRKDGVDLLAELQKEGYQVVTEVADIKADGKKTICIDEEMEKAAEAKTIGLLAETTARSIDKLSKSSPEGFFLMVEGAKIDYAGHSNCFPGSIVETLSFDMAVAEALKFADKNGETLVIVTGDHETGGLTLIDGSNETGYMTALYVTDDHTPIMLPVFTYGPQANKFIGKYANYEIARKIKALMKK